MNILEKFIREQSKTNYQFAKMVGLTTPTINAQINTERLNAKNTTINTLINYMFLFNVSEFSGNYKGKTIKIEIS